MTVKDTETLNGPLTGPFHQHLDKCKWCADHPFELCPMGRVLIQWEANSLAQFGKKPQPAR